MKGIIKREATWDYDTYDENGLQDGGTKTVATIETWEFSAELGRYELTDLVEKDTGEDIPYNEADYIRDGAVTIPVCEEDLSKEEIETIIIPVQEKTIIAIIQSEEGVSYVEEKHISPATFKDWFDADFSYEDAGLHEVGENEKGETLYESDDFEGQTLEELEPMETGWHTTRYWDGQNWNTDVFEYYDTSEVLIVNRPDLEPSPKYYYVYELIFEDGKSIITTQSNESGSLAPYYYEDNKILEEKKQQEESKRLEREMYSTEDYEKEQTNAEKLADFMNTNSSIPDEVIDEFEVDQEGTIKKYSDKRQ